MELDPETTQFFTAMRESIESKIDSSANESREAVRRVEGTLSSLSREIGEQTMALNNHKAEDDRVHGDLADDIDEMRREGRQDERSRMQKAAPAIQGTTAAGLIVGLFEWFRNIGS